MTTRPVGEMQFEEILQRFNKVLELKSFAELGQIPRSDRTQVVVCFADIRGFTKLVERTQKAGGKTATELLSDFFPIFPKAVLREAWDLEHEGSGKGAFQQSVRKHIFPSFWKRLGDGMLIVWDFNSVDKEHEGGVKLAILDILGYVQEYFYKMVELKDDERLSPLNVDLGIGLAIGEAWKLDFGLGGQIDYVGSPLNLAARLQNLARPKGICVHAKFAPTYLIERHGTGEGKIEHVDVAGLEPRIPVWRSESRTLKIRRLRTTCIDDDDFTGPIPPPYEDRPAAGTNDQIRHGISEVDIESLLETRRRCEARFASEAARLKTAQAGLELVDLIDRTKSSIHTATKEEFRKLGKLFHEAIARLGGPEERAERRVALVQYLHKWTTEIYPEATTDREKITEEHEAIVNAILSGPPHVAAEKMKAHLRKHDERVTEETLSNVAESVEKK